MRVPKEFHIKSLKKEVENLGYTVYKNGYEYRATQYSKAYNAHVPVNIPYWITGRRDVYAFLASKTDRERQRNLYDELRSWHGQTKERA
jgi:hypothetical protein